MAKYFIDDNGVYYLELAADSLYLNTDTSELLFQFTPPADIYRLLEDGGFRLLEDGASKRLIQ